MWGLILGLVVIVVVTGIVVCLTPAMLSSEISQQEERAGARKDSRP